MRAPFDSDIFTTEHTELTEVILGKKGDCGLAGLGEVSTRFRMVREWFGPVRRDLQRFAGGFKRLFPFQIFDCRFWIRKRFLSGQVAYQISKMN